MVSSESGEDFESADEDFDFNKPSSPKIREKSANITVNEATTRQECSNELINDHVNLNLTKTVQDTDLKDDQLKCKAFIDKSHDFTAENKSDNAENLTISSKSDPEVLPNILDNLSVKQKNTSNINVSSNVKYITDSQVFDTIENDDAKLPLTLDTLSTELKPCSEGNISLSKNDSDIEVEELIRSSKKIYLDDDIQHEVNTKSVDGWDLEEEDAFEIPETLEKDYGQSSKLTQKQGSPVKLKPTSEEDQGWGGWGGWGMSSILSTATDSVSTLSSQVTAGLSTIMETTVGAPNPESLANNSINNGRELTLDDVLPRDENRTGYSGLDSLVSGVSLFGSTVINRGLDTLETLGKKTMEVLQEGDPGLMKKRALLFPNQDKPVLSQILRDAKLKADTSDKEKEEKETARKIHFESLFDDFQGMVHLEALEMLSTQCELKLQSLLLSQTGPQLLDFQETLSQVRDLCELPENEEDSKILTNIEFSRNVINCVKGLNVNIPAAKIIQVNETIVERLSCLTSETASVVNQAAISSLAEFTAAGMELYHKSAELLLAKSLRNTPDEAENYYELTTCLCARVSAIANEFTQLLTKTDPIANSHLITNIFLEASNSYSYIRNSCQLLVPILQDGAVSS